MLALQIAVGIFVGVGSILALLWWTDTVSQRRYQRREEQGHHSKGA
jgi:hypothetical protein